MELTVEQIRDWEHYYLTQVIEPAEKIGLKHNIAGGLSEYEMISFLLSELEKPRTPDPLAEAVIKAAKETYKTHNYKPYTVDSLMTCHCSLCRSVAQYQKAKG